MAEKLLTVSQAAEILQIKPHALYNIINAGQIRYMKLGRKKIRESEFDSFVQWAEGKDIDLETGKVTDQVTGEVVKRFPETMAR